MAAGGGPAAATVPGKPGLGKQWNRVRGAGRETAPGAGPTLGRGTRGTSRASSLFDYRSGGFAGNPYDEDVVDPLGMPLESYRAIAWELDQWIGRLLNGLYGPAAVPEASGEA